MIRRLKTAKSAEARSEDDAKVRQIVETTLAEIEAEGDSKINQLSEKFDDVSRDSYRLTAEEIEQASPVRAA